MSFFEQFMFNLKQKNADLTKIGKILGSYIFPFILNPNEYSEDYDDGGTVEISTNPEQQLDSIVKKCYDWRYMNRLQRKSFSNEIVTWLLTKYGIRQFDIIYEDDEDTDTVASIINSTIKINEQLTITQNTPWPLIEAIAHETSHRVQVLSNQFAKTYPEPGEIPQNRIFNWKHHAYKNFINDKDLRKMFYNADLQEIGANAEARELLYELYSEIENRAPNGNKTKLLTSLSDYIDNQEYNATIKIDDQIEIGTRVDEISQIEQSIRKSHYTFIESLSNPNNIQSKELWKEHVDTILDDELGHRKLQNYLYYSTVHLDQNLHRQLLHSLIENQRLESLLVLNTYGFQYSVGELNQVSEILLNNTNEGIFVPLMFKFLTHVKASDIIDTSKILVGEKTTRISLCSMNEIFKNTLEEKENLRKFNNRTINLCSKNQYSLFLNNAYPYLFEEFAQEFLDPYLDEFVDEYTIESDIYYSKKDLAEFSKEVKEEYIDKVIDNETMDNLTIDYMLLKTNNNQPDVKKDNVFDIFMRHFTGKPQEKEEFSM